MRCSLLVKSNSLQFHYTGAIELSVFSEYYETELDVVDIQTQRIDQFGKQF